MRMTDFCFLSAGNDTEDPRDGLKAEEKAESNVPAVIIPGT